MNLLLQRVFRSPFLRNLNDLRYEKLELLYEPSDLTPEYYEKVKTNRELEHQIGRLQNFRDIIREIADKKLAGDFIEFGVWKGFSLLWSAYFCQKFALFDKTLTGVDGFVGLPNEDGEFEKGAFSNTSRKICEHGLRAASQLHPYIKANIAIHQSLFNEKAKMHKILGEKKFVFIHIDCDLGSAATELFERFRETDCLADSCFILFDDYGCVSSLKKVVDEEFEKMSKDWIVSVHSVTNLTKNFYLQKRA